MHDVRKQSQRRRALADRLHELRSRQRLSQEELATRASITRGHYNKAENAKQNVSIDVLWAIADALGVHVTELLKDGRESPRRTD